MGRAAGFVLVLAASALAGPVEKIQAAKSAKEVEALASKLEPGIGTGDADYEVVYHLARALARFERVDRSVSLIRRYRGKFRKDEQDFLRELEIRILDHAGRLKDAIAAATARVNAAPDKHREYYSHRALAELLEKKGDWKRALEHYLVEAEPSFCWNCDVGVATSRALDVARCRFFMGQVDRSLAELEALMIRSEEQGGPVGGELYCEFSVRTNRLDRARRRVEKLPEDRREAGRVALAISVAFVAKDPGKMLEVLEDPETSVVLDFKWVARLLDELGEPARKELAKRIGAGSEISIFLAEEIDRIELLPALKARLAKEKDEDNREFLENAIEKIETPDEE